MPPAVIFLMGLSDSKVTMAGFFFDKTSSPKPSWPTSPWPRVNRRPQGSFSMAYSATKQRLP